MKRAIQRNESAVCACRTIKQAGWADGSGGKANKKCYGTIRGCTTTILLASAISKDD
jgi:hypothetical protein